MVNAFVGDRPLDGHEFTQRNQWRNSARGAGFGQRVGIARANAQRQQFLGAGPAGERQLQDDVHVLLLARDVEQIHGFTAHGDAQRFGNRFGADAVERGLFLVDDETHLRLVGLDVPVRVHDARRVGGKCQ